MALLCGGGVLLGVGAAIGAFVGNPEHIQEIWAGASFHADSSAAITEVIDWDFGSPPPTSTASSATSGTSIRRPATSR